MAMMPKRVKHRKSQRGRIRGNATRGNRVVFGDFALQATQAGWVSAQTIEAGRIAASQYLRTEGRLYIRVFPHKSITSIPLETRAWEEARCPVCHAQPLLSWVLEGKRRVSCSFCDTEGYVNRTGCPVCQRTEPQKQKVVVFDGEEEVRMETCDVCRSYIKTVDGTLISRFPPEIADLMSLPLDIIVQEKGYARRSPNPIGMRTISTRG